MNTPEKRYYEDIVVTSTEVSVTFAFCVRPTPVEPPTVALEVTVPLMRAKEIMLILRKHISDLEEKFGPIRVPPETLQRLGIPPGGEL